jgi:hypothetical protein
VALRTDGSLVAWGWDLKGQVSNTPTDGPYAAVAAGEFHGVALRADGSLVSWGEDFYGQVTDTPTGNGFVAVAAGTSNSIALRADGSLVSWGYDADGQVTNTPSTGVFTGVAAGLRHVVALRADGSLVAWGNDDFGAVSGTPSGTGFVAVDGGNASGVALRADGTLASWGYDAYGQVTNTPTGNGFVGIAAGGLHFVAIQAAPPPPPPPCEGVVNVRLTRVSGPDPVAAGTSSSWTVTAEVTACQTVTGLTAQGGTAGRTIVQTSASDGDISVRNANKNNSVLLWEIGSIKAGTTATATLLVHGTVGAKAVCGSDIPLTGEWSVTADAGAGPIKYGTAGPVTVKVGC